MTGPSDTELDAGCFDDELHENHFGFPLLWRREIEPRRDELDEHETQEEDHGAARLDAQ